MCGESVQSRGLGISYIYVDDVVGGRLAGCAVYK